jgi:hypothetical protein
VEEPVRRLVLQPGPEQVLLLVLVPLGLRVELLVLELLVQALLRSL